MGNFFGKMTGVFCFHYLSSFFFRKIKMTSTDFHVEAIDRLCFVCGFIIMKNGHHILLVLKEATSLTFERSINLLENVTSNNICHSCWAQRCPLFRGFHIRFCINSCRSKKMCPLFGGVRYSEVSAIRRCPLLASPLLRAFTVHSSEVSIELQTSVVETIYI